MSYQASSTSPVLDAIRNFLRLESASGILLVGAALLAMALANSPLAWLYDALLETPVAIQVGAFAIHKPLLLWINDGLMAVFFFLVGLELKREILDGELSRPSQIALPAFAAVGGMLMPALIYYGFNSDDAVRLNGWAIPAATDIAFALGILLMLGNRVPTSLKVFLMSLAILDDIGAIIIIALFYTEDLSISSMVIAGVSLLILFTMNRFRVMYVAAYLLVGLVLWASVLKSGVHATLAGVALAFMIPLRDPNNSERSPLRELEHDLHPSVAYFILPLFAFANSGVSLKGIGIDALIHPVTAGVALGLFFGKQLGVFVFSWLVIRLGIGRMPSGATWTQLYGVALLCGIGFTMSLFIGGLAFEHQGQEYTVSVRLGILGGTLVSALLGYLLLRVSSPKT